MQVSEWPYCSNHSSPPQLSCSRHGFIASASFNLLSIYKNTPKGLKAISSAKAFDNLITTISWCNSYDLEGIIPLILLVGFDNGSVILFDVPSFSIISTFPLSESAITSSEWSNIHSNHFFVGCQNGDLISVSLEKSTEKALSYDKFWSVSCSFPIEQLHTNENDCQMLMVASNQGKFAIYDLIYNESPSQLFTGSFEEDPDIQNKLNSITSTQNTPFNSNPNFNSNATNTFSTSAFFDIKNSKIFVQCGFHPHLNDIFYFVTQTRIFYGFIKEKTTVSLFPTITFNRLVGVFFPASDENAIAVIQRHTTLLLSFSLGKGWKSLCEITNFMSTAVSYSDCKFDKNSFIVASKGNNLSIIKYYRRKLFYVTFMRSLANKPSKIAVNSSFYAFIVAHSKTQPYNPTNNLFLYLAPQITCMTDLSIVYNINLNHNYNRNYCSTSNFNANSSNRVSNGILFVTQIEWITDTDLIFSARCQDNKHKLFYFNYERRELLSILKPQLEFLFLEKPNDFRPSTPNSLKQASAIGATTSINNSSNLKLNLNSENSENSNIKLSEIARSGQDSGTNMSSPQMIVNGSSNNMISSSILVSSTNNFTPAALMNPLFTSYYSTLVNNDLSIRFIVHRNQKYFAATIGNSTIVFFKVTQSETPKPLLFQNSSVVILPEPAAVSFIDEAGNDDKITIFYKDRIDICSILPAPPVSPPSSSLSSSDNSITFELIRSYQYHSELRYTPMIAHSFTPTFHLIILENGEIGIVKVKNDDNANKKYLSREGRKMSVDSLDSEGSRKMSTDSYDLEANNVRKLSVDSVGYDNSTLTSTNNEEPHKLEGFIETLGKMTRVTCLRVANDGTTCIVIGDQQRSENVGIVVLSKSGKSKIIFPKEKQRVKRCDYVSNSIIFVNIIGSRCFSFCSLEDRVKIDTPHHEVRNDICTFEDLKNRMKTDIIEGKRGRIPSPFIVAHPSSALLSMLTRTSNSAAKDSEVSLNLSSSFDSSNSMFANEEMDVSTSSEEEDDDEIDSESELKIEKEVKKLNENVAKQEEVEEKEKEFEEKEEELEQKELKLTEKVSRNLNLISNNYNSSYNSSTTSNAISSSQIDFSSKSSASMIQHAASQLPPSPPASIDTHIDVSLVSLLADQLSLFYLSDLLRSVSQMYDPFCYGINMNKSHLVYYLRSFAEILGEAQPQPLNRRQAIYQKLSGDDDGTLSRLLTVGVSEDGNHTKNMLKVALSALQLNEENFQMMLDVLLENGVDEDTTDIIFFSGKYDFRAVERFVVTGEIEFAVLATRLLLDGPEKEKEKAISLIVDYFNENKRKHQVVPFLLGLKRFDEAARYLDDYGEHKCAAIVRALVVPDNENDGHVFLDYSKIPNTQ